jgi:acetyl esterase/lipase
MSPRHAPAFKVERNLVFAHASGRDLTLDLFLPETTASAWPVVIWIFGGGYRVPGKDQQVGVASWLALRGFAVAAIDYRMSYEAKFPAQIHDCKAAVRWLRAHAGKYRLDSERIGAWGASSGGHLAAMLGTSTYVKELEGDLGNPDQSSRVSAVVDFYGPTDFLKMDAAAPPGGAMHDPPDSPESELVGGPIQENREKATLANPISYITPQAPPFLILHGELDPLVPVNQSELLFAALKHAGTKVTFLKLAGVGHGGREFDAPTTRALVWAFFDQHLCR